MVAGLVLAFYTAGSPDSSVGIATGWELDTRSTIPGRAFRPALGPTHPPVQLASRCVSPGAKRPGLVADHSLLSSAEVNVRIYIFTLTYVLMAWCLIKCRDNFTTFVGVTTTSVLRIGADLGISCVPQPIRQDFCLKHYLMQCGNVKWFTVYIYCLL
jgi:hypothetical protein